MWRQPSAQSTPHWTRYAAGWARHTHRFSLSLFHILPHTHTHTHSPISLAPPRRQCRVLARAFEGPGGEGAPRLFLIVHSLCGVGLRSAEAQEGIAALAAAPRIHIAASIDHVHAAYLWPQHLLQRFNWVSAAATDTLLFPLHTHTHAHSLSPTLSVSSTRTPQLTGPTGGRRPSPSRWWPTSRSRGPAAWPS